MELRTTSVLYRLRWWSIKQRPYQEDLLKFVRGLIASVTLRPLVRLFHILAAVTIIIGALVVIVVIIGLWFPVALLPFGIRPLFFSGPRFCNTFSFGGVNCIFIRRWPFVGAKRSFIGGGFFLMTVAGLYSVFVWLFDLQGIILSAVTIVAAIIWVAATPILALQAYLNDDETPEAGFLRCCEQIEHLKKRCYATIVFTKESKSS